MRAVSIPFAHLILGMVETYASSIKENDRGASG